MLKKEYFIGFKAFVNRGQIRNTIFYEKYLKLGRNLRSMQFLRRIGPYHSKKTTNNYFLKNSFLDKLQQARKIKN